VEESDGRLNFVANRPKFTFRALAYSERSFQSEEGFELTVSYYVSRTAEHSNNVFSFGLMSSEDLGAYNLFSPFGIETSVYSIGVNLITDANLNEGVGVKQGIYFADGTSLTLVDEEHIAGGSDATIVMSVLNNGAGGATVSWSVDGVDQGTATIASFDFSKSYSFVTYGQDNETERAINSVSLSTIAPSPTVAQTSAVHTDVPLNKPEQPTNETETDYSVVLGLLGLGALLILLFRHNT
jgi:hypothetical protein